MNTPWEILSKTPTVWDELIDWLNKRPELVAVFAHLIQTLPSWIKEHILKNTIFLNAIISILADILELNVHKSSKTILWADGDFIERIVGFNISEDDIHPYLDKKLWLFTSNLSETEIQSLRRGLLLLREEHKTNWLVIRFRNVIRNIIKVISQN